jgi:hypothetical protein
MITASNIHCELADRVQGLNAGGIGAMLLLARRIGLISDIDHNLHVLRKHWPYHESDHVLNIAFNIMAGGRRIEHIELRRNDEVYLNALGAQRLPDPTTEGDFCRRFSETDVVTLMNAINQSRLRVWAQQPSTFLAEAILDVDGTLVSTDAECKQGINIAYNGVWGYHPLLISLANTSEPLYLINRSGNRASYDHAAEALDKMINLSNVKPFIETLLVTDPVRQSRASSREASLAWGWATVTAKRGQRDQTLWDLAPRCHPRTSWHRARRHRASRVGVNTGCVGVPSRYRFLARFSHSQSQATVRRRLETTDAPASPTNPSVNMTIEEGSGTI